MTITKMIMIMMITMTIVMMTMAMAMAMALLMALRLGSSQAAIQAAMVALCSPSPDMQCPKIYKNTKLSKYTTTTKCLKIYTQI